MEQEQLKQEQLRRERPASGEYCEELGEYCEKLAGICTEADQWVERNGALVENETDSLRQELRRSRRAFRRCARSLVRKMCAGVFGPCAAGKSYLISALARDSQGNLMACFGDAREDFIKKINPPGGKESTGLVTRFTMTRPDRLPEGHPVRLRLLSEPDLVKIIANTYFADCRHRDQAQSDISAVLTKLNGRRRPGEPRIDLDDLEDIREYLLKNFAEKSRVQELERTYWGKALLYGPQLGLEDRVELYSLIWDDIPELTGLFRALLERLDELGHAEEAYCGLNALIPRDFSIIDVQTLNGLTAPDANGNIPGESLDIVISSDRKASDRKVKLPRAVAAALTAELVIVMAEQPARYFDDIDLLDFPGYRPRLELDDVRALLKRRPQPGTGTQERRPRPGTGTQDGGSLLAEMFLRGKVAYLFQRYSAERELSALLLCIAPGPQDVPSLPGVIDDWIRASHGDQPKDRADKKESLLFVLTKCDLEFQQKAGVQPDETNGNCWTIRLKAALLDYFGRQHDWPRLWNDRGEGFKNLFLLRNPNVRFDAVLDYDDKNRETEVRATRADYVEKVAGAFRDSDAVRMHFHDPKAAWDALMQLNDGGITRIRESLDQVCDPALKLAQLKRNIADARAGLLRRLEKFYRKEDGEDRRTQAKDLINELYARLDARKAKDRLGLLLRGFTVHDTDILTWCEKCRNMPEEEEGTAKAAVQTGNRVMANPFARPQTGATTSSGTGNPGEPFAVKRARQLAAQIETSWVSELRRQAADPAKQEYFMLPGPVFTGLASELATGMTRLKLRERMFEDFKRAAQVTTALSDAERLQTRLAAHIINRYVEYLGLIPLPPLPTSSDGAAASPTPEADRERRSLMLEDNTTVVMFEPLPEVDGFPVPKMLEADYTGRWWKDWLYALQKLIMDNADYDGTQTINRQENAILGELLKELRKEAPAA